VPLGLGREKAFERRHRLGGEEKVGATHGSVLIVCGDNACCDASSVGNSGSVCIRRCGASRRVTRRHIGHDLGVQKRPDIHARQKLVRLKCSGINCSRCLVSALVHDGELVDKVLCICLGGAWTLHGLDFCLASSNLLLSIHQINGSLLRKACQGSLVGTIVVGVQNGKIMPGYQ
jgi:hypothetical protein